MFRQSDAEELIHLEVNLTVDRGASDRGGGEVGRKRSPRTSLITAPQMPIMQHHMAHPDVILVTHQNVF